ncbi:phosphatase PAP2 family protein [Thermoactinospora rubra]|uniref:phosphatase PAP2 family protein n=1 Tax=Thermoactinospora rubra TaxID=1088767 RepID=UPI00197FCBDF|nr:phosphatase PAP2 family protein [Thermoactinospora rubra]
MPDRSGLAFGFNLGVASAVAMAVLVPFTLLALLVKVAFEPLHWLDKSVAGQMHDYAVTNQDLTRFVAVWTDVLGPWPWRVAVLGMAAWAALRGARRLAIWAIATITVGGLTGGLLKIITDRARPAFPDPVALAPGESFPSGHALTATLGAGVIVLMLLPVLPRRLRIPVWAVAAFLALSVAWTRVALGVHWVSDALGGVLLGVGVIAATTIGFERWRRESGRRPAEPYIEGVEPEAAEEMSHR